MKFELDFSVVSSADRMEQIRSIDLSKLTPKELDTVSNYVLYGKDEDGTSCVDRGEVYIKTKFGSYEKNKTVSLDYLLESPTFDETVLVQHNIYKKGKQTIDKERAAKVPGMKELWEVIEYYQDLLDQNTGKKPMEPTTRKWNRKELHYYTHYLISLKTQQYQLLDSYTTTAQPQQNHGNFFVDPSEFQLNYPVLPRGVIKQENDDEFANPRAYRDRDGYGAAPIVSEEELETWEKEGKRYFSFLKEEHVYQLILHYGDLRLMVEDQPDSPICNLLNTLDFYIGKAGLSPQQRLIVEEKKLRRPNKEIAERLKQELGISHQENYVSTIWGKAVGLICAAAELNYDEWLCRDYDKAWKVCGKCGRELFRDERVFVKKQNSPDGLTRRCKECDRALRKEREAKARAQS